MIYGIFIERSIVDYGTVQLSASMLTEPDMKSEVIQRAQVGSLMGANGNNEPQNKTPKKQSPTSATRPKMYALEMWVEIETSAGVHTAPEEDSYSVDFAIDTINHAYPRCTGMYLGVAGHMLAFYGKKTNPRAGLLIGQAVVASKAIDNIPTWMRYFARWRVKCVSISEASEILAGCKRIEKENLRRAPATVFCLAVGHYPLCYCSTVPTSGRSAVIPRG